MARERKTLNTTNLDLASLLVANGHECKLTAIGPIYARFSFEKTSEIETMALNFARGKCEVNITVFMYARLSLKRELKQMLSNPTSKRASKTHPTNFKTGEFYYMIEGGKPFKQLFAPREPHIGRVKNGNAFRTLEEAETEIAMINS